MLAHSAPAPSAVTVRVSRTVLGLGGLIAETGSGYLLPART